MTNLHKKDLSSLIFEAHQDAILILSTDYTIKSLNPAAATLLEATTESLIGETFPFEINQSKSTELEIPTHDDCTRIFELSCSKLNWRDEPVLIVTLHDITAQANSPDELESYKELLTFSLNAIASAAIATDHNSRIVDMNAEAAEMLNLNTQEVISLPLDEALQLLSPQTGNPISNTKNALLQAAHATISAERILILNNRSPLPTPITVELRRFKSSQSQDLKNCVILLNSFASEEQITERSVETQRRDSINLLAAGIAHDFNNILSAILGNISVVRMQIGENNPCSEKLMAAEDATMQAKSLSQQLMTFSKAGTPVLKTSTVGQLIDDSTHFLLRGSNVKYQIEKDEALWPVDIDGGQICQVLNNLIINADQAMPSGGDLQIRVKNKHVLLGQVPALPSGNYVCIEVQDKGTGIDETNLKLIFEPYFTTKDRGNGIGLSSSFAIIKNHGGLLMAESTLGQGSTFSIYLPQSTNIPIEKTTIKEDANSTPKPIHKGQGRILVMDDLEAMMNVAGEILSILGYEVAFSTNGQEAIDVYMREKEAGRGFDAVVFDLTVPGAMGGEEAAEILMQYDPELTAIASSGYSSSDVMSNPQNSPFKAVVPKPYRIKEMSDALDSILRA